MTDGYFDRVEAQLAQLTRSGAHLRGATRPRAWFSARGRTASVMAGAISLAVVAAVVVVAFRARPQSAPRRVAPAGTSARVAAALQANLQVLRRPEQRQDRNAVGLGLGTVPCSVRQARRPQSNPSTPAATRGTTFCTSATPGPTALQRRYGLEDPATLPIRHVAIPTTRIEGWLIAGSRGACWNAVGPRRGHVIGERCFSSTVVTHSILLGTIRGGKSSGFEIGLVTDTAHAVELRHGNGRTTILPLRDGYFYARYRTGDTIVADTADRPTIIQTFR